MDNHNEFIEKLEKKGVSRREFMKFCSMVAVSMGLASSGAVQIAEAVEKLAAKQRPAVIWLHFSECTGCSEAFLRAPNVASIILDLISVEYHETIMAAAGHQAEENLHNALKKYEGKFVCVVEGAIATAYEGAYGKVGGRTFLDIAKEVIPKAAAVISLGTCSAYGGLPAAEPNPGGYKGVKDAIGVNTINLPGCPPNPLNLVGTIINYLEGKEIELDQHGRPIFAYGKTVHDNCPRLQHYNDGLFAESFDSEEAEKGYCLYYLGCKGQETYNNCPTAKFNFGTSFPIQAGHPCIGCSEPYFWDSMSPFYKEL
jgi:[NiFe] hydrogenase small subunit